MRCVVPGTDEHWTGAADPVGDFRYHHDGDRWEWSDTVARMHGYTTETIVPTTELIITQNHPDDRHHITQTLHTIRTADAPFGSRHRIIDTSGTTRSLIVVGESTLDNRGEVIGSSGFLIDVTETLGSVVRRSVDKRIETINISRSAIEQAKGILMFVYGIPADRAFDILVWRSQETNVKVRDIAEHLIRTVDNLNVPITLRTQFDHLLLRN